MVSPLVPSTTPVFSAFFKPQPKQMVVANSPANEILYGGAAGPGKSWTLRWIAAMAAAAIPGLQVYLFRRTRPELERNHIIPSRTEYPKQFGSYREQKNRWDVGNGSMIHCCHCQYEKDVFQYQGAEIDLLLIDELTTFNAFQYDYLRGRVRPTTDYPAGFRGKLPGIICASNPGGIGHGFCKERWIDPRPEYKIWRTGKKQGGMLRQYIPGLLADNKVLMERDPEYINRLNGLPEPYRTAYMTGDWDIFIGQMFAFTKKYHTIDPIPVPENATIYMTFDWGFGRPYSVGWWWIDNDGRLYRFNELYGCLPGQIDVGLRHTADEVAERILEHEHQMGITERNITRFGPPDCWNKLPNYASGGQKRGVAETFTEYGLVMNKVNVHRKTKIQAFHDRLRVPKDAKGNMTEWPMMLVYNTCEHFIKTVPLLQALATNVEEVNQSGPDHQFDDACLICQMRELPAHAKTAGIEQKIARGAM